MTALAHHGSSISYQLDKTITLDGVVTEGDYRNSHPQIYFDVNDKEGAVAHWAPELNGKVWPLGAGSSEAAPASTGARQ